MPHSFADLLICLDLLARINEKYVSALLGCEFMLEGTPGLPDSPFQQIALDCTFEEFLRDGDHDAVDTGSVSCHKYVSET